MENFKISLSDLYLNEEQQISEDGYDQRGGYEYKLKVGDRRYILTYDVGYLNFQSIYGFVWQSLLYHK